MMTTQPFAIPALALFVAVPLALGLIPRNRFYGIRTAKALSDDDVWYRVNRLGGWAVVAASAVYGGVAALWPYDRSTPDNFSIWGLHLAGFIVPLVVGLGLAIRSAKRL